MSAWYILGCRQGIMAIYRSDDDRSPSVLGIEAENSKSMSTSVDPDDVRKVKELSSS